MSEGHPDQDTRVIGIFHERAGADRAVQRLTEKSVPVDSIRVFVVYDQGRRKREIAVEDEAGALKGALLGAGVGAAAGLVVILLAVAGVIGGPVGILGLSSVGGAVRAIALCAAAGVPLGALLGMGRWESGKDISQADVVGGEIHVVVESRELASLAREILRGVGADRLV